MHVALFVEARAILCNAHCGPPQLSQCSSGRDRRASLYAVVSHTVTETVIWSIGSLCVSSHTHKPGRISLEDLVLESNGETSDMMQNHLSEAYL